MKTRRSMLATGALLTTVALAIAGCGGSSSDPSSSASSGGTSQTRPSGVDPTQLKAIQKCLKAAGLSQSFPTGVPSGIPSNLPSDLPSNLPSGGPTGVPSNFSGGPGGGQFNNPQIQAALKACGIQLPTPQGG